MTFLEQCIQDSMPIWRQCLESEFVQGVAHGTLPEACFKGYIVDDSLYLREYSKVFAWGMLHSHDMEEIRTYYSLLSFVNESEDATRRHYLRRYGITDEEIQPLPLRPENRAYVDCMLTAAREGALKLKEISYVFADGCHAAELKHGPISLLGPATPVIALANRGPGHDKLLGNIAECRARRSPIIALATTGDDETGTLADDLVVLPEASAYATPILDVVALQLFAYYFARQRKCEIDQPRNLAKSVTVE